MPSARTASPRTARAINDRIALDLLAERGALTAAQLRELTGLSRPSIADLLTRLADAGLVTVVGESGEQRRGPNARLYGLVAGRAHVAALDVRTHEVTLVLADLAGRTVGRTTLPVGAADGQAAEDRVVAAVVGALTATMRRAGVRALHRAVMGAPGLADPAAGTLQPTGGLPTWHAALLAALRAHLDRPVVIENEANLAALAELRSGAVRDRDTFVLLWLGRGIGGAVVLDGALRRGASGGAGEIAFLPVPAAPAGPAAGPAGADGYCTLAGADAVISLARAHGLAVAEDSPAGAAEAAGAVVREAARQAAAGEAGGDGGGPQAAFLTALADRVAPAVAAAAAVLDPGCVVLGGEIGRAGGQALARRVQRRTAALTPVPTEVRPATVAGSPVLGGALTTALEATRAELFGPAAGRL